MSDTRTTDKIGIMVYLTPQAIQTITTVAADTGTSRNKFIAQAALAAAQDSQEPYRAPPIAAVPCHTPDGPAWLWIYPHTERVEPTPPPGWPV